MLERSLGQRLFAGALILISALVSPSFGAKPPDGKSVYRQDCARCHGKSGEGVKGKYDDALYGDWSLEKLTRYIHRTMPEDDPGSLSQAESEAVARYINDAFYSREARARNKPPRIEVVRLTNRQYVNAVADLLKSFGDPDGPVGGEQGLRGSYRNRARRHGEQETLQRTNAQVNLDFGASSPFAVTTNTSRIQTITKTNEHGTNVTVTITNKPPEYSISWRGVVVADEPGDYEFIVRSPNGVRLWVNSELEPLIDASVASGDMTEHRATIRLLGSRGYPLRLEFNKAERDKTGAVSLLWRPPHGEEQLIPARHLSPKNVSPTFIVTTPFPPDDSSVGYERGVSVSKDWHDATTQAAIQVANHVIKNLDRYSKSKASDTNRAAKVEAFCADFVSYAFRRPLTDEQKRTYVAAQFKDAKLEDAVKRVVLLALKSPRFLYLGLESTPDDYEIATRLAFGLWDSLPDAELRKAAAKRSLQTWEQVEAQARRMLRDPRARAKVQSFLHGWLQMDRVEDVAKDHKLFPGFTPEVIADLRASLNLFLHDVVWSDASDYRRLLLEDDLWVNNRLAKFYGIATNTTDDFWKVNLNPKERCGVVTHPYLLAAFSYHKSTSPIHRGVFLTRNIVGRTLKPPPVAVSFDDAKFSPNLTMRQKVEELTRSQACQSCHSVINPLGFTLEHYDAVGRFRTLEGDKPIDAASEYITDEGTSVKLTGARDVADFAIKSSHAQNAFVEQLFHAIVKQPILAYGRDVQERLRQSWVNSGFNIQKLIVETATLAARHGVNAPATPGKRISHAPSNLGDAAQAATEGSKKS
jgi:hypothetical protein